MCTVLIYPNSVSVVTFDRASVFELLLSYFMVASLGLCALCGQLGILGYPPSSVLQAKRANCIRHSSRKLLSAHSFLTEPFNLACFNGELVTRRGQQVVVPLYGDMVMCVALFLVSSTFRHFWQRFVGCGFMKKKTFCKFSFKSVSSK